MIPRYQRILFYSLLGGIILMAIFLFYERKRAHDRLTAHDDATPLAAPVDTATESYTLDMASDGDGSIEAVQRQVALPEEPSVKARALLERLVAEYALPKSKHPLASGAAVDDVFLLNLPITTPVAGSSDADMDKQGDSSSPALPVEPGQEGQLAVVNLRGSFVNDHPSGVNVEMLTILSMLGTLHANFAQITQVRFLVDGQPRETLAGHVDLSRVYPAIDTTVSKDALQPTSEGAGDQH
jgi:hypothetical protein